MISFAGLLIFIGAVLSPTPSLAKEVEKNSTNDQLPPLFDYENYEKIFGKHYEPLEEAARRAYFIPRALHVFTSAVSYRFRQSDYHLALNHLSDKLPAELEIMRSGRIVGENRNKKPVREKIEEEEEVNKDVRVEDISDEEFKAQLEQLKEAANPMARDLLEAPGARAEKRVKRSIAAQDADEMLPVRELNLADLISTGQGARLPEGVKVKARVRSNNKNYQPLELDSQGIEPKKIKLTEPYTLRSGYLDKSHFFKLQKLRMEDIIETARKRGQLSKPFVGKESNVLYQVDHSQGACMDLPRVQGDCGACYAFTAITIYEWLYCKKFGELVQLSEQYMIDCGKVYVETVSGCEGGEQTAGPDFVQNFGLELRANYPYSEKEQSCPLDRATSELQTSGYIRFDTSPQLAIPYQLWQEYLHFSPLDVTLAVGDDDFFSYKRGIHTPKSCDPEKSEAHAMVLVGYGIEDGQEFWKIRNSYGTDWGEDGYYRMPKAEKNTCFLGKAYAYATSNGHEFQLDRMRLRSEMQTTEKPAEQSSILSWLSKMIV